MPLGDAWRFSEGYRWDGGTAVEVFARPGGVSESPGWREWAGRFGRAWTQDSLYLMLLLGVVWIIWPHLFSELALAGMALYALASVIERLLGRGPYGRLYHLSWDDEGVLVETAADAHRFEHDRLRSVLWEPVEWHGWLSRQPIALGGAVRIALVDGGVLEVGRGFDHVQLRALAEQLSEDLKLPMVEQLARPLVRSPEQLQRPVTGMLNQLERQWRHVPSYSNWKVDRTAKGCTLSIGDGRWSKPSLMEVLDHYGTWLITVLVLDLLRLPITLFASVMGLEGVSLTTFDVWEVVLHTLALAPVLWGLFHDHQPRVLTIDRKRLTYEVNGHVVSRLRVRAIEQVRYESFPSPAVRIVTDTEDLLIEHLPSQVDYEVLADQLPHLLPRPNDEINLARDAQLERGRDDTSA